MSSLSKWKLGVYVLAIFLAGGGSGAFVGWQMCRRTPVTPVPPAEIGAHLSARFQSQLALTPEQLQKIDPMIDEAMHRVEAIRKETASQVFANVTTLHEQVLAVLTPEQLQKIDPMIDEAMHRVEAIRKETASQVFANVTTLHEQVLAVLTPEQKVKFEVLERERRERLLQKFGPATNSQ